jgi:hypothetical protein
VYSHNKEPKMVPDKTPKWQVYHSLLGKNCEDVGDVYL